jgi:glycosyltransferase involved in cell wall biosynthesis
VGVSDLDVVIAVSTYGSDWWRDLARTRAIPSARRQGVEVIHSHGATLAEARNESVERAGDTEWIVHLDADDELEPGFLDAMAVAAEGGADVLAPSVHYVRPGSVSRGVMPKVYGHTHHCVGECLPEGNWLVVGSMVRVALVRAVGGWRDWTVYEDWDLWLRCWLGGGKVEAAPDAVYRAHVRSGSRNRSLTAAARNRIHHKILASVDLSTVR